jgi:hypothetical protein
MEAVARDWQNQQQQQQQQQQQNILSQNLFDYTNCIAMGAKAKRQKALANHLQEVQRQRLEFELRCQPTQREPHSLLARLSHCLVHRLNPL